MNCRKCGAQLQEGTRFCGNCGADNSNFYARQTQVGYCGNCGAKISNDAGFCGNCGAKANSAAGTEYLYTNSDTYKTNINITGNKSVSSGAMSKKIVTVLLVAGIAVAAGCGAFFVMQNSYNPKVDFVTNSGESGNIKIDEDSTDTTDGYGESIVHFDKTIDISIKSTEPPVATPYIANPIIESAVTNIPEVHDSAVKHNKYYTYNDFDFGFKCDYPSDFELYDDGDVKSRYTLKATDGSGTLRIAAIKNDAGQNVRDCMNNYINRIGGNIDYQASGNDWYAIRMKRNNMYYYEYCKVKSEKICWFEMNFKSDRFEEYDEYINYIYNSFNVD